MYIICIHTSILCHTGLCRAGAPCTLPAPSCAAPCRAAWCNRKTANYQCVLS